MGIQQYHLHKRNPEKLQFEVYDLKTYRSKSGDKASSPHSHSYYQIIWFFKKGGTHTIDFEAYDINENTILFVSKDQPHAFDDNLAVEGWLLHFNESFFMHSDVDIFLKYNIFKNQKSPCYAMEKEAIATAKTYMKLLLEELAHRNRFGFEENVRFLLKLILVILERAHLKENTKTLAFNNHHERQFYLFKDLVEERFKEGISVKDYAEKLQISPKTLTTITKEISGRRPTEVIHERILLESKRLLRFTTLTVGEIGFSLGLEDPSYFIKFFKRHEGVSPRQFREKATLSK